MNKPAQNGLKAMPYCSAQTKYNASWTTSATPNQSPSLPIPLIRLISRINPAGRPSSAVHFPSEKRDQSEHDRADEQPDPLISDEPEIGGGAVDRKERAPDQNQSWQRPPQTDPSVPLHPADPVATHRSGDAEGAFDGVEVRFKAIEFWFHK